MKWTYWLIPFDQHFINTSLSTHAALMKMICASRVLLKLERIRIASMGNGSTKYLSHLRSVSRGENINKQTEILTLLNISELLIIARYWRVHIEPLQRKRKGCDPPTEGFRYVICAECFQTKTIHHTSIFWLRNTSWFLPKQIDMHSCRRVIVSGN